MTLSSALAVSSTSLQTISTMLQVTANNISNAQTPGYTEETANISSIDLGGAGGGSEIVGYTDASDAALTASVNQATSQSSLLSTQNNYMQQVQTILGSSDANGDPAISAAVSNFQSAWTQFAAAPNSSSQQSNLIQAGNALAQQLNTAANSVESLNVQVENDTQTTVNTLNTDLQQVQSLNQQISTGLGAGQNVGELYNQRDVLVNDISAITNVSVFQRGQGQIALYTSGGTVLLDGEASQFSYDGTNITNSGGSNVTTLLNGGSLQAEVDFRLNSSPAAASTDPMTEVVRKLDSQLNAISSAFTNSSVGPPATFAYAYTGGSGTVPAFFTGTDAGSFAVNASLVSDPTSVNQSTANNVVSALNANSFSFTADGMPPLTNASYATLTNTVLSDFQQTANTISASSTSATAQQQQLSTQLSNETGVNTNTELVNLTDFQNAYAASAHVISVIDAMYAALENIT